jgi:hypothetical protein
MSRGVFKFVSKSGLERWMDARGIAAKTVVELCDELDCSGPCSVRYFEDPNALCFNHKICVQTSFVISDELIKNFKELVTDKR